MKSVLFLTNLPSPYRVDFFNELGKYCRLTVVFERSSSSERDMSWKDYNFINFEGIILKGISTSADYSFCPSILKYINRKYDYIICSNATTFTGILAIQYMKKKSIPYWIEGDGAFAKNGKGVKEKIKKYVLKDANGYFSTSKTHDQYYLVYGADSKKIFRYPFTSMYSKDIQNNVLTIDEKCIYKQKVGIKEDKCILFVGQFIPRKGIDVLLEAAKHIGVENGIYLVGGTPTEEMLNFVRVNKLQNIHFLEFMLKEDLADYFKAADVFVLPTREDIWGLVINEAMSYGLPVVSTNRCGAALELVDENINGYIVDVENSADLADSLNTLISNDDLIETFSLNSLNKIKNYTIENMARRHVEVLNL